ncbi:hypothetical protein [Streptomyces sp. NPDC048340]
MTSQITVDDQDDQVPVKEPGSAPARTGLRGHPWPTLFAVEKW